MQINHSITGALVFLILAVIVIGVLLGLALADTDILNPHRSEAEAERIRQEAAIQAQREAIDLQAYQREQELRLQALEQQQADERAYRLAQQEVSLSLLRLAGMAGMVAFTVLALAGACLLIAWARRLWIQSSPEGHVLREQVYSLNRENERLIRRLSSLEKEMAAIGEGNGRHTELIRA